MELNELKSSAYDCLVQIEVWQTKLKKINEAIVAYTGPKQENAPVTEVKPD